MKCIAITIVLLLQAFSFARADALISNGSSLLQHCEIALKVDKTGADIANGMYLLGYVNGVLGAHQIDTGYKIPPDITNDQKIRIIKKWLDDHPKTLNQDAGFLILYSLMDAFPAKK
jgi:Ssp1 endopeptidase immunity protein Rap1a